MARDAEWATTPANIDKFTSFMTDDARFAVGGMPAVKGHQAVKDALGPLTKAPGFSITWKATSADVSASGDLGYTAGTYALTGLPPGRYLVKFSSGCGWRRRPISSSPVCPMARN